MSIRQGRVQDSDSIVFGRPKLYTTRSKVSFYCETRLKKAIEDKAKEEKISASVLIQREVAYYITGKRVDPRKVADKLMEIMNKSPSTFEGTLNALKEYAEALATGSLS